MTRKEVIGGVGAIALFIALLALGFMLVDAEVRHEHPGKPDPVEVPQVPWR